MHKIKALLFGKSEPPAIPKMSRDISVHPLSQEPTLAWDLLKSSQSVIRVTPLEPDTPVSEDKVRFVCLSDTHETVEALDNFVVPPGDVLLHAGDFTQMGFPFKIKEFNDFLGSLPHKVKLVIAGNHDLTLDDDMVQKRSQLRKIFPIKKQDFEDYLEEAKVSSSRELLTNCIYLLDSYVKVCGIKIYGSPWQPNFGGMAFNMRRGAICLDKWNQIPEDTDILMTHGPPIGHGDLCSSNMRAGCVELLHTVQRRVKPKYHLFGHIHEGYGVTTDGQTIFINGSTCTLQYKPDNKPIVFDFPVPDGHLKSELCHLPVNNLHHELDL